VNTSDWSITTDESDPVIATAIHAGHDVRADVIPLLAISEEDRLREEDPSTDRWLAIAANRIHVTRSRFEVDLNRPRENAVYRDAAAAWGNHVWRSDPPATILERAVAIYDSFYAELGDLIDDVAAANERFVVLDLHSYNHRRGGPDAPVDDPDENPEINVGTGSVDRSLWSAVIDAFSNAARTYPFDGGHLDVRENVRFKGGHMSRWINDRYAGRGCTIAVEVKKFYMDEWSGVVDESMVANLGDVLSASAAAVRAALEEASR
jgi:N-formylglutamate amidohydrolase